MLICYGDQLGYHHGAKYQILKNHHWFKNNEVCVVTDKPELFEYYPVRILTLDETHLGEWSLNRHDHFGIKLMGLHWAIGSAPQNIFKSILLDTDMFWTKNPEKVAKFVNGNTLALYQNEGMIIGSKNRSIQQYEKALGNQIISLNDFDYQLSTSSQMWGSAIIGIQHSNSELLKKAFCLFQHLAPLVNAHTIEQFALSETARLERLNAHPSRKFVENWSSIGKKNYVTPILRHFFTKYGEHDFDTHLEKVSEIKIRRPVSVLLRQKLNRWNQK